MAVEDRSFSAVDYVIFALMLCISAGIGIFYGCFAKKQTTSKEILVANRQMNVFPVAMSLLASFMSGITILGNPSEIYYYGTMFWWSGIAYTLASIVTSNVFIPLFRDLDLTSAYEYLEKRFGKNVKIFASCVFIVQMTIYMALVLYAPALALNQVTGLNTWISVVSIGVVCTFYTTIGGMKAVIWTDVFQMMMMLIGLLSSLIKGIIDVGGVKKIVEINWNNDRVEFFNFDFNPTTRHTVWGLTIGSFFQWLAIYGVNQSQVQRYMSVKTTRMAKRAIYWNLCGLWVILSLTLSVGLVIFAKYQSCDPVANKEVKTSEQLYPLFVMETLRSTVGLPGLFLACLFSAALSTISSGLNSLAAVVLEDIIKGIFIKDLTEEQGVKYSKILCIVFGLLCLVFTYLASFLGAILQAALSLFGVIGGPLLGVFILGVFFPFANQKGAIAGLASGLIFTVWIFVGFNAYGIKYPKKPLYNYGCNNGTLTNITTPLPDPALLLEKSGIMVFHSISYTWYGSLAVLVVCSVGVVVSLLTGPTKPGEVEARYIIPIFDKLLPCLPKFIRKQFYCGFEYHKEEEEEVEEIKPIKAPSAKSTRAKTNRVEPEEFDMHSVDIAQNDSKFVFGSVGKPSELNETAAVVPDQANQHANKAYESDVEI